MRATGTFSVKKWEENPYKEISPEMKMTKASVVYALSGEIEGTASVEYLMFYHHVDNTDQHKSSASYVGLFRLDGKISGKSGSVVMEDRGTFVGGTASSTLQIVAGSGTGELKGIAGQGKYQAGQSGIHLELDYLMK